jgi:3-methyl-2-oxobutanoate hydroxymethyltransferase
MIYHAKAVRRAVKHACLIGDMPYEAYQKDVGTSVENAGRFIGEAGCDAVKLEWFDKALESAEMVIKAGIPVMGHIGLTPQTADKLGGYKVQGKDAVRAKSLIEEAGRLEGIGCFSILLECVPEKVAEIITRRLKVPTIGIGAGCYCDGQVLVTHDMLGLFDRYSPKFVKKYMDMSGLMRDVFKKYKQEVLGGVFPSREHSFAMNPDELKKIEGEGGKFK